MHHRNEHSHNYSWQCYSCIRLSPSPGLMEASWRPGIMASINKGTLGQKLAQGRAARCKARPPSRASRQSLAHESTPSGLNRHTLAGLQCRSEPPNTSDHTYGMKKSSGSFSSTYLNFSSGNFCRRDKVNAELEHGVSRPTEV